MGKDNLEVLVCTWKAPDVGKYFQKLYDFLPTGWLGGVDRYKRVDDKFAAAVVRSLLYTLLKGKGQYTLLNSEIELQAEGKPYFRDSVIYFSFSHTEGIAACVLGLCPMGVDIERLRIIDFEYLQSALTADEWVLVHGSTDPSITFFLLWTARESILKALGTGLKIPADSFSVNQNPVRISGKTFYHKFVSEKEYALSVAAEGVDFEMNIREVNIETLFS